MCGHRLLGFHSDMLAAVQPCLHSKIHTTQHVFMSVCTVCRCIVRYVHAPNTSMSALYISVQIHKEGLLMGNCACVRVIDRGKARKEAHSVCYNLYCQCVSSKICMPSGAEEACLCVTVIVPLCLALLSWKRIQTHTHAHTLRCRDDLRKGGKATFCHPTDGSR